MEGLGVLLFYALLFYLMMRFGCGAHMVHGHGNHGEHKDDATDGGSFVDPVCGHEVESDKGYGLMHDGTLYRFCSRQCLEQFDDQPSLFIHKQHKEGQHEH